MHVQAVVRMVPRLLSHDLLGVEFNKHAAIRLEFIDRNEELKVVEKEELKLQMVELHEGEAANLGEFSA